HPLLSVAATATAPNHHLDPRRFRSTRRPYAGFVALSSGAVSGPEGARREAEDPAHAARQVALVGEARLERDLARGELGPDEERAGALDAPLDDVLVDRDPDRTLEELAQV